MSEALETAKRLIKNTNGALGRQRPADYDLHQAQAFATIALAEAVERFVEILEAEVDDNDGYPRD